MAWRDLVVDRAESVRRTRARATEHVTQIMAAARELYYETDGGDFTIQQLAVRAGIATQTFYRHFRSKDELLLALLEDVLVEGTNLLREAALSRPDPLSQLEHALTQPILMAGGSGALRNARVLVREAYRLSEHYPQAVARIQDGYHALLVELIEAAVAARALPARANVDRDARLLHNLVTRTFNTLAIGGEVDDVDRVAAHTWAFCLSGLRAPDLSSEARRTRRGRPGAGAS